MLELMTRHWWVLILRGLAAVIFSVLAFVLPGMTLGVLVLMFGAYMLVDGAFRVASAIGARRSSGPWGLLLLHGLLGIGLGIFTWIAPGITAVALLAYIAVWAVITGVLEIVAAIRLRHEIHGELWLGLSGALSIAFGVLLLLFPLAGALTMIWMLAGYTMAFGISMVVLGVRMRRMARRGAHDRRDLRGDFPTGAASVR
jgi:uncharacterized membrane protein HdeD (DUF308 family)